MALNIRMPFFYAAAVAILGIVLVFTTWGYPAMLKIVDPKRPSPGRGAVPVGAGDGSRAAQSQE